MQVTARAGELFEWVVCLCYGAQWGVRGGLPAALLCEHL